MTDARFAISSQMNSERAFRRELFRLRFKVAWLRGRPRVLVLVVSALLLSGCATSQSKSEGHWGALYSGTRCDLKFIGGLSAAAPVWWIFLPFTLVDLPLSFVADTVVLPIDFRSTPRSAAPLCPSPVPRD